MHGTVSESHCRTEGRRCIYGQWDLEGGRRGIYGQWDLERKEARTDNRVMLVSGELLQ